MRVKKPSSGVYTVNTCTEKPLKDTSAESKHWLHQCSMLTAAGTCISSIYSEDFQGNNLESQKYVFLIFSCYRSKTNPQFIHNNFPKATFCYSFSPFLQFETFPISLLPAVAHSFQPSSPYLNPQNIPTYFNSMAALLSPLLWGEKKKRCSLSPNPSHL